MYMHTFENYLDKMQRQAELDKQLHTQALAQPNRFNPKQRQMLSQDLNTKAEFQQVLELVKNGQMPDRNKLIDLIQKLEYDKNTHHMHMNRNDPNTGSPEFHQKWIQTYDGWLTYLRQLAKQHGR